MKYQGIYIQNLEDYFNNVIGLINKEDPNFKTILDTNTITNFPIDFGDEASKLRKSSAMIGFFRKIDNQRLAKEIYLEVKKTIKNYYELLSELINLDTFVITKTVKKELQPLGHDYKPIRKEKTHHHGNLIQMNMTHFQNEQLVSNLIYEERIGIRKVLNSKNSRNVYWKLEKIRRGLEPVYREVIRRKSKSNGLDDMIIAEGIYQSIVDQKPIGILTNDKDFQQVLLNQKLKKDLSIKEDFSIMLYSIGYEKNKGYFAKLDCIVEKSNSEYLTWKNDQ